MTLTAMEKKRRYLDRRYAEIDAMPRIQCECGCGTLIPPISRKLKPQHFAHGHNPHGVDTRFRAGDTEMGQRSARIRRERGTQTKGSNHPQWRGGEWRVGGGYVRRTIPAELAAQWPTALRHGSGWSIQRSHAVWNTTHPDDPVQPGEQVHHRNLIRDDDRPENLRKMRSGPHIAMHNQMKPRPRNALGQFA